MEDAVDMIQAIKSSSTPSDTYQRFRQFVQWLIETIENHRLATSNIERLVAMLHQLASEFTNYRRTLPPVIAEGQHDIHVILYNMTCWCIQLISALRENCATDKLNYILEATTQAALVYAGLITIAASHNSSSRHIGTSLDSSSDRDKDSNTNNRQSASTPAALAHSADDDGVASKNRSSNRSKYDPLQNRTPTKDSPSLDQLESSSKNIDSTMKGIEVNVTQQSYVKDKKSEQSVAGCTSTIVTDKRQDDDSSQKSKRTAKSSRRGNDLPDTPDQTTNKSKKSNFSVSYLLSSSSGKQPSNSSTGSKSDSSNDVITSIRPETTQRASNIIRLNAPNALLPVNSNSTQPSTFINRPLVTYHPPQQLPMIVNTSGNNGQQAPIYLTGPNVEGLYYYMPAPPIAGHTSVNTPVNPNRSEVRIDQASTSSQQRVHIEDDLRGNFLTSNKIATFDQKDYLRKEISSPESSSGLRGSDSQVNEGRTGKVYQCEVCTKTFGRAYSLTRHRRIHTGDKPYNCSVCGKGFTQSYHLKIHMKTHSRDRHRSREL